MSPFRTAAPRPAEIPPWEETSTFERWLRELEDRSDRSKLTHEDGVAMIRALRAVQGRMAMASYLCGPNGHDTLYRHPDAEPTPIENKDVVQWVRAEADRFSRLAHHLFVGNREEAIEAAQMIRTFPVEMLARLLPAARRVLELRAAIDVNAVDALCSIDGETVEEIFRSIDPKGDKP